MSPNHGMASLLDSFRSASGSPKLIWYGPSHERVELSGRVLENWVAKTSNLLVEELDGTSGTVVAVDLPPHWKSLVWALASWQVGALTRLGCPDGPGQPADLRLSMNDAGPGGGSATELLVLVAPGALDMRWPGSLPRGAVDYAAVVRSFGDVYLDEPAGPGTALVEADGTLHTLEDLAAAAPVPQDGGPAPTPGVWLVPASLPLLTVLRAAVRIWTDGGTVVLVHPEVKVTDRLLEGERITARLSA